jgi:hypothetical protein
LDGVGAAWQGARVLRGAIRAGLVLFGLWLVAAAVGWPGELRGPAHDWPAGWRWPLVGDRQRNAAPVFLAVAAVAGVVVWAGRRLPRAGAVSRRSTVGHAALLCAAAYVLAWAFLAAKAPSGFRLLVERESRPMFSGYFTTALAVDDVALLGPRWAEFFPRTCRHCRGHPPGRVVMCFAVLWIARTVPGGAAAGEALGRWLELESLSLGGAELLALFAIAQLKVLCAAAVPIFVLLLALRDASPRRAFFAAGLTAACPGLVLMLPEFDQTLALSLTAAYWLACRSADRSSVPDALLSGVVVGAATYQSFFALPFGLPLALVWAFRGEGLSRPRRASLAAACGAGVVSVAALLALAGTNLIEAFVLAYRDVERLPAIRGRPYSLWVFYNLVDFFQFAGLPAVALAAAGARLRSLHAIAGIALLGVLDVWGVSPAEVGRIWVFFMPLFHLGALAALERLEAAWPDAPERAFLLQLGACTAMGLAWYVP